MLDRPGDDAAGDHGFAVTVDEAAGEDAHVVACVFDGFGTPAQVAHPDERTGDGEEQKHHDETEEHAERPSPTRRKLCALRRRPPPVWPG